MLEYYFPLVNHETLSKRHDFLFQYFPLPSLAVWGLYAAFVGILFAIIKYTNFRLHQLFDTTDCIEEIVRPVDSTNSNVSQMLGLHSLNMRPSSTPEMSRNPSHSRTSHSYHHASHHHAIQHYHEASPNSRERAIGARLADIQLTERGYRGGDDDDQLAIGGVGTTGMIELRDLGALSTRNGSGNSQLEAGRTGYENPRRDSNASLTDLTRASYAEATKEHDSSQTFNQPQVANDTITISAETIRERVAAASVTSVAAARAALASATSNLRRRGGHRSHDQNRAEAEDNKSNNFNLQVDMHSDPLDKEGFEAWHKDLSCESSNNDDVLEQVFGRRSIELEKCFFGEHGKENEHPSTSCGDNDMALEISELKSDDVVVIVDESSPEHKLSSKNSRHQGRNLSAGEIAGYPTSNQASHISTKEADCENRRKNKKRSSKAPQRDSKGNLIERRDGSESRKQNDNLTTDLAFGSSKENKDLSSLAIVSSGKSSHDRSQVINEMESNVFIDCKSNSSADRHPRRRFSNLSNLAQSLPSTNSSASALMHSRAGLGSVDLAAILNRGQMINRREEMNSDKQRLAGDSSTCVRRTQSALVNCSSAVVSAQTPRSGHKPKKSSKKPSVKLKTNMNLTQQQLTDFAKSDSENLSEEEREIVSGSRSPLLTRSMSLEKISSRQYISGTVSFDPTAGDSFSKPLSAVQDSSNRGCSIYSSDMDMETYQAELQEATNALLDARKYLIACDKSEVSEVKQNIPVQKGRKQSWSAGQTNTSHGEGNEKIPEKPYFSLENNANRTKFGNPNYLGVVGPLDWLFSDSEPEPGPSSPKLVHKKDKSSDPHTTLTLNPVRRHRTNNDSCSSQASSGTDTETRSLLNKDRKFSLDNDSLKAVTNRSVLTIGSEDVQKAIDFKATGAIPKKRTTPAEQMIETSIQEKEATKRSKSLAYTEDFDVEDVISDDTCKREQNLTSSQRDQSHQQRRSFKLLSRRRPPTPPTGSNLSGSGKDGKENEMLSEPCKISHPLSPLSNETTLITTSESTSGTTAELKQRILEILSSSSPEECQRELAKLKKELENRNKQMAAALSAAQLPSNSQENISTGGKTVDRILWHPEEESDGTSNSNINRRRKHHRTNAKSEKDNVKLEESTSEKHRSKSSGTEDESAVSHSERRRRRRAERRRLEREERARLAKGSIEPSTCNTSATASIIPSTPALVNILAAGSVVDNASTHLATDHEDTTEGAIHCFQDELGNWHSYTFGQESSGTARTVASASIASTNTTSTITSARPQVTNLYSGHGVGTPLTKNSRANSNASLDSFTSGLTVILDSPAMSFQPKRSSSINNSSAMQNEDGEEEYSQSGGTLGSIAGSSITNRTRYERRGSSSERRIDVGSSYTGQRSTGVFSHQLSVVERPFDRQQSNTTNSTLGSASGNYRSHRSPLHLFAESLLERTRLAASAATTAVGNTQSQVSL